VPRSPANIVDNATRLPGSDTVAGHRTRLEAEEAVRRQLTAELHDGLGAELVAARFALANLEPWLAHAEPAGRHALETARRALDAAVREQQRLLARHAAPCLEAGLGAALADWSARYAACTGLSVRVVCAADARFAQLPEAAALTLYRIAQEALSNVSRHARAGSAEISLAADAEGVALSIRDDGAGMPEKRRRGHGIDNMHARSAALGGALRIGPRDDGMAGTLVQARFAWRDLAAAALLA
jgi:signal transduction histidine kinase